MECQKVGVAYLQPHPYFLNMETCKFSLIVIQYIGNIYKDLNSHIVVGKSILAIPYKPLETRSMCFEKQD